QFCQQLAAKAALNENRLDFLSAVNGFNDCTNAINLLVCFPLLLTTPPMLLLHIFVFAGEVTDIIPQKHPIWPQDAAPYRSVNENPAAYDAKIQATCLL